MKIFDKGVLEKLLEEHNVKTSGEAQDFSKQLLKEILEALYGGELADMLGYKKHQSKSPEQTNSRNGHSTKTIMSKVGTFNVDVPRDREGKFEPKIIKKYQKDISVIEDKIISLYGKGMSMRDISEHIQEIYGFDVSPESISTITDTVIESAKEWQNRSLEKIYSIVFMDALIVKMKVDNVAKNVAVYCVLGINLLGRKEVLGLYINETESAKYWLTVMNELKNRGVEDILIFCVDNLSGISEAIRSAFPKTDVQKCIVHQIRNSLKFVSYKDRKEVVEDLKNIYSAPTEKFAQEQLLIFSNKWDKKYPYISRSWNTNWTELSTYFKYSSEVKKLIYTTNPIESLNRYLRKVSKNKSTFPNENAVIKLFYLAINDMEKKWTMPRKDWSSIISQLLIFFEDRLKNYNF